jgi:metal-dependent amidase/aminoacylase/carboxypeptidase family protein
MEAGKAFNVVPDAARLCGTFRTLQKSSRETVMRRFNEICENTASAYGCTANIEWTFGAPATVNHSEQTKFAAKVARDVAVGVDDNFDPLMGSEDFSYMLEERPGTYVFLGAGPGAGLHHPEYDFNDEISPVGASFFVKLVETSQPLSG